MVLATREEDALYRWLLNSLEEVTMPWASLRQKCVHHGNEKYWKGSMKYQIHC